jgi:nucleotide-binding universal stress UspA family protein
VETVVVGLDDASPADAAPLRWATDYCRLGGDELVGIVAFHASQSEAPPDWYEERLADARKDAEAEMDVMASCVPHRVELLDGDPRSVIPVAAREDGAAVVVVGARGTGGFLGLGLGSVAHSLAHHLLMPLVIVPRMGGPLGASPVVVGLDGSRGDVATLAWAVRLAAAVGSSVVAVYASDPMAASYPHRPGATIADQKEELVRAQVAGAATEGVDVTFTVEIDHPVTALTRVADQRDASVIVVGRRGAGHLRGALLGRVPAQLPFHTERPVAIIPRRTD